MDWGIADADRRFRHVAHGDIWKPFHDPAQSNYSADDLEATALVYALKSVEWLAQTRPTTIITDNSRVLHIKDWSPSNRRQKRLLTYVMQFPLTIVYIRGSKNLLPDALSRLWQDSTVQERKQHEATFMHDACGTRVG